MLFSKSGFCTNHVYLYYVLHLLCPKKLPFLCTDYDYLLGWVNFSEFEITVLQNVKKTKITIFNFLKFTVIALRKSLIILPTPYIVKKPTFSQMFEN